MGSHLNFKAFVDASAGSAGALFAALVFYPLDVAKIRKQAHLHSSSGDGDVLDHSMLRICCSILKKEGVSGLFVGLSPKALHTVIANFAYFYWYSFLKNRYKLSTGEDLTTVANVAVASMAGALNMTMTLPLEMITTRSQTNTSSDKNLMAVVREIYQEKGLVAFWKGYAASLVLVSNPAINYTLFDRLKLIVQTYTQKRNLSAMEAFMLGAIAKAVATIITYPIIRAKVLMQAQKKDDGQAHRVDSLGRMMAHIGKVDGVSGYYKGCNAQLFNTVIKSALLLMTKEQITAYTMRVLFAMRRNAKLKRA